VRPPRGRAALGEAGEQLVARHLEREGFQIVGRNVRVGRLELDLVARRGSLLVFCEVRTRASRAFVDPIDTIDAAKQQRIRRAAEAWLRAAREQPSEVRFDAASVVLSDTEQALTYYESAF
jgi:putative endonuclease